MLTNRLSDSLKKNIYSFLVESNLDLINPHYGLNSMWDDHQHCSTLSIIRRINKDSKRITQDWQDKFQTFLKPHLDADSDFKKFYLEVRDIIGKRNTLVVGDLLKPIFNRMSQAPADEIMIMLKSVLNECDKWEDRSKCPESKNIIEKTKFELREAYINLGQLLQLNLVTYIAKDLKLLRFQYKYLIIERIMDLLFKKNSNFSEKTLEAKEFFEENDAKNKKYSHLQAFKSEGEFNRFSIKCLLLCCMFPLVLTAIIGGVLMEDGQGRDALLGTTISFSILSACISWCCRCDLGELAKGEQIFQNFRTNMFNDIDGQYRALNDKERKTVEAKLDLSVQDSGQANDVHIDIMDEKQNVPLPPK